MSRSAARSLTRCSASRLCRRYPTDRARIARCCGAPRSFCSRPATSSRTAIGSRRRANVSAFEFLVDEPSFQPHHMPFIKNLRALGIDGTLRIIDAAQMQQRLKDFDFDVTIQRFGFSATPGESLRTYFSSQAAAVKGSQNLAGIADPAIDAMIDRVIAADTRAGTHHRVPGLDRVFRAGRNWIPHWYKASHWIAYWDTFGRPSTKPRYARGVLETWWHDSHKASKIIEAPG